MIFELEGEKLCLINTEVIMLPDGKIIFSGKDEQLRRRRRSIYSSIYSGKIEINYAEKSNKLSLSQLRVGIFMLVALLVLGFLILNSSGNFNPFEKKLHLRRDLRAPTAFTRSRSPACGRYDRQGRGSPVLAAGFGGRQPDRGPIRSCPETRRKTDHGTHSDGFEAQLVAHPCSATKR